MFREDICVSMINDETIAVQKTSDETVKLLMNVLSFTHETPRERILMAVKEEVAALLRHAQTAVDALQPSEASGMLVRQARQILTTNTCYFPRVELLDFVRRVEAHPQAASEHNTAELVSTLRHWIKRHESFEKRLSWLLHPNTLEEIEELDPTKDYDQIFHFVSYQFRSEMKIFAVIYQLRAVISSNLPTFFLSTDEFNLRSVRRVLDTILLFANVMEWGIDSERGRTCIQRINEIHGRYYIPNEGFRYILYGIIFIPCEWNQTFGWRKFTEVEKLGWFHAFINMGRAMNIDDLGDNFDEEYAWYLDYSKRHTKYSPVKRRLFDNIVTQVLAEYPAGVRPLLLTAIVAGMDDTYHVTTGYPVPPEEVFEKMRWIFYTLGQIGNALPRGPWIRSLQSNVVYPYGYRLDEMGVPSRSRGMGSVCPYSGIDGVELVEGLPTDSNEGFPTGMLPLHGVDEAIPMELPTLSWDEIQKHNTVNDLWVVVDGYVYDLSRFAHEHPGGLNILQNYAGKDASLRFHKGQHQDATQVFKLNFRIGRAESDQPPVSSAAPQATEAAQ